MAFVANEVLFPEVNFLENRLRFDKVKGNAYIRSSSLGDYFLTHPVSCHCQCDYVNSTISNKYYAL